MRLDLHGRGFRQGQGSVGIHKCRCHDLRIRRSSGGSMVELGAGLVPAKKYVRAGESRNVRRVAARGREPLRDRPRHRPRPGMMGGCAVATVCLPKSTSVQVRALMSEGSGAGLGTVAGSGRDTRPRLGMMGGCAVATGLLDRGERVRGAAFGSDDRSGEGRRDLGAAASDHGAGASTGRDEGAVRRSGPSTARGAAAPVASPCTASDAAGPGTSSCSDGVISVKVPSSS